MLPVLDKSLKESITIWKVQNSCRIILSTFQCSLVIRIIRKPLNSAFLTIQHSPKKMSTLSANVQFCFRRFNVFCRLQDFKSFTEIFGLLPIFEKEGMGHFQTAMQNKPRLHQTLNINISCISLAAVQKSAERVERLLNSYFHTGQICSVNTGGG